MYTIQSLWAREIFDSRGLPTIEVILTLNSGQTVTTSVPTGQSRGSHEPLYLYDTDRFYGLGVVRAIRHINETIAPMFIGKEPYVLEMDQILLGLDPSENKAIFGANTLLAVSTAMCKAHALADEMELYELIAYLSGIQSVSIPFGMFNVINGGVHALSGLPFQEILITPMVTDSFAHAYQMAAQTYYMLKQILKKYGLSILVGDEGGFAPAITAIDQVLELLLEAINKAGFTGDIMVGIDAAASQFFDPVTKLYRLNAQSMTSQEMIDMYANLIKKFGIYSIEDGLADCDWDGWLALTNQLGDLVQLVGDDIFVTNSNRIVRGIEHGIANTVLIKPSQAGTITETLQAIKLCMTYNVNYIVSHRSGETNDTFIADLALGTNATHIKAGSCARGERVAKYNRLVEIEQQLIRAQR